jgi:hypothetical protein
MIPPVGSSPKRCPIDDKPVLHIALPQAFVSLVDLLNSDSFGRVVVGGHYRKRLQKQLPSSDEEGSFALRLQSGGRNLQLLSNIDAIGIF